MALFDLLSPLPTGPRTALTFVRLLRGRDSNPKSLGYEPNMLPLHHPAWILYYRVIERSKKIE